MNKHTRRDDDDDDDELSTAPIRLNCASLSQIKIGKLLFSVLLNYSGQLRRSNKGTHFLFEKLLCTCKLPKSAVTLTFRVHEHCATVHSQFH